MVQWKEWFGSYIINLVFVEHRSCPKILQENTFELLLYYLVLTSTHFSDEQTHIIWSIDYGGNDGNHYHFFHYSVS